MGKRLHSNDPETKPRIFSTDIVGISQLTRYMVEVYSIAGNVDDIKDYKGKGF
jgi:hypothetical protein